MSHDLDSCVGRIIDERFTLRKLLGRGGMASVYEASQFGLTRPVALKLMHVDLQADPEFRMRFLRECKLLAAVSHPFIIKFLHFGVDSGNPYLAMEYCQGRTLRSIIDESTKESAHRTEADELRCIELMKSIAEALVVLHAQNIVHRDLTPQNILVTDIEKSQIKVIDFGLALLDESNFQKLTHTGALVGSLDYMSPEQCMGTRATTASDIYSLGCILFEMLEGSRLFPDADSPMALLHKHQSEQPRPFTVRVATPYLEDICRACLDKKPANRPTSEQLVDMIEQIKARRFDAVPEILALCQSMAMNPRRARLSFIGTAILLSVIALSVVVWSFFGTIDTGRKGDKGQGVQFGYFAELKALLTSLEAQPMGAGKDLLQRWLAEHERASGDSRKFAELAEYYQSKRPDLCLFVCEAGLGALRQKEWDEETFETLLHFKLQSLGDLRMPSNSIKQAMESEYIRWQGRPSERAIKGTEIEVLVLEKHDIAKPSKSYFSSFAFQAGISDRSVIDSVSIMLKRYWSEKKFNEFSDLAKSTLSWIGSGSKLRPVEVLNLCASLTQLTHVSAPSIALHYWSLLPPDAQNRLCTQAPYDVALIDVYFGCGKYGELQDHFQRLAKFYSSKNRPDMALESYRQAIHYANLVRKEGHGGSVSALVLEQVDFLFGRVIDEQLEFWIFRAMATVQEELDLGHRREALKLLRFVTNERIRRLPQDKQDALRGLLRSHQK